MAIAQPKHQKGYEISTLAVQVLQITNLNFLLTP